MSLVAKGGMMQSREGKIITAGNTFNLQYMSYRWCATVNEYCMVYATSSMTDITKVCTWGIGVMEQCRWWTTATAFQQSTSPKVLHSFYKITPLFKTESRMANQLCTKMSAEFMEQGSRECSRRLSQSNVLARSPVSHCLGQSTIITSLWSPWFSNALAMHYSLKRLRITRAECWKVFDGAINITSVPLICNMLTCIWGKECMITCSACLIISSLAV